MIKIPPIYCSGYGFKGVAGFSKVQFFKICKSYLLTVKLTEIPRASVRALAVFEGPIPPELTADTLMTYIV